MNTVVAQALQKRPEARPFIQEMLNRLLVKSSEPTPSWKRQAAIIGGSVLALSLVVYVAWGVVVQARLGCAGRSGWCSRLR